MAMSEESTPIPVFAAMQAFGLEEFQALEVIRSIQNGTPITDPDTARKVDNTLTNRALTPSTDRIQYSPLQPANAPTAA